jgi:hypothetical protein
MSSWSTAQIKRIIMDNKEIAMRMRSALETHEASWDGDRYRNNFADCLRASFKGDPLWKLVFAGHNNSEAWEFVEEVLGPAPPKPPRPGLRIVPKPPSA